MATSEERGRANFWVTLITVNGALRGLAPVDDRRRALKRVQAWMDACMAGRNKGGPAWVFSPADSVDRWIQRDPQAGKVRVVYLVKDFRYRRLLDELEDEEVWLWSPGRHRGTPYRMRAPRRR